mgnify:CR=1 FL=1
MHLNLFVSQKCFLYCKGCYSFSRTEKCGQIVSTEIIVEFLKYAYNEGINKVTLCGGDPLTRKDIINILEQIKSIGYLISLDTIGTSIIKNIVHNDKIVFKKTSAELLTQFVDTIGIPIDGSTNNIFKLFRQTTSDLLNEQLEICEELHKCGANICINTVVHKGNLDDANDLSNLIKKLDYIDKWQIFQFAPLGKFGILNRKTFEITDDEFNNFKTAVLKIFDDKNKIQFKGFKERNSAYMLIDNYGNAWTPIYDKNKFDDQDIQIERRKIIGNINNTGDWDNICYYLKK